MKNIIPVTWFVCCATCTYSLFAQSDAQKIALEERRAYAQRQDFDEEQIKALRKNSGMTATLHFAMGQADPQRESEKAAKDYLPRHQSAPALPLDKELDLSLEQRLELRKINDALLEIARQSYVDVYTVETITRLEALPSLLAAQETKKIDAKVLMLMDKRIGQAIVDTLDPNQRTRLNQCMRQVGIASGHLWAVSDHLLPSSLHFLPRDQLKFEKISEDYISANKPKIYTREYEIYASKQPVLNRPKEVVEWDRKFYETREVGLECLVLQLKELSHAQLVDLKKAIGPCFECVIPKQFEERWNELIQRAERR